MRKLCSSAALAATVCLGFGVAGTVPVSSQILHGTAPLPSFEVETIKPQAPFTLTMRAPPGGKPVSQMIITGPPSKSQVPADRVSLHVSPAMLIAIAYNLPLPSEGRVIGGPDWLKTDNYEIQAKIPETLFADMQKMPPAKSREQRLLMEQSLLATRFHLKVHFETRDMPIYALVVAKSGPRLTPAKEGEPENMSVSGDAEASELNASGARLEDVVRLLQMQPDLSGRMLINQTGLSGTYNFALKWSREQGPGPDNGLAASDAPSFFTALLEQLGLRLVPTKAPIEVVVVDHIDRPSEN